MKTGPFKINTWIVPVAENNVLIIDPAACSFCNDGNIIVDYLEANKLNPAGIVLTHGHFDHITGTRILKNKYPECRIAIHKEDALMAGVSAQEIQGDILNIMGLYELAGSLKGLPDADILLKGGETLDNIFFDGNIAEQTIKALSYCKIIHTPGHSKGSICMYNENLSCLFSGDTIFYNAFGRTDLPGGNYAELVHSIDLIKKTVPHKTPVFPGHDHYGFALGEVL